MTLLNILLIFIGSVIGSVGSSTVILYLIKRRDKVADLIEHNNRIAEGLALMSECQIMMLDAMHDKGIVNGNGQAMKEKINTYMMKNTVNGYHIRDVI